jgi:hypothetical protein
MTYLMRRSALAALLLAFCAPAALRADETQNSRVLELQDILDAGDSSGAAKGAHRIELVHLSFGASREAWVSRNCAPRTGRAGSCEALRALAGLDAHKLDQSLRDAEGISGIAADPSEILCETQVPQGRPLTYFDPLTGDQDRLCFSERDRSYVEAAALIQALKNGR